MAVEEGGFGDEGDTAGLLPPVYDSANKRKSGEVDADDVSPTGRTKRTRVAVVDETLQLSHAQMRAQLANTSDISRPHGSTIMSLDGEPALGRLVDRREWTALLARPTLPLTFGVLVDTYKRVALSHIDVETQAKRGKRLQSRADDEADSPPRRRRALLVPDTNNSSSSSQLSAGSGGFGGNYDGWFHDALEQRPGQDTEAANIDIGRALAFATPSPVSRRTMPWMLSSSTDSPVSPSMAAAARRRTPSTAGTVGSLITPRRESGTVGLDTPATPTRFMDERLANVPLGEGATMSKETSQFYQYISSFSLLCF